MPLPSLEHVVGEGSPPRFPKVKQGAEPSTLREPPPRGVQNVPWPAPLSGRGYKALLLYKEFGGFP